MTTPRSLVTIQSISLKTKGAGYGWAIGGDVEDLTILINYLTEERDALLTSQLPLENGEVVA